MPQTSSATEADQVQPKSYTHVARLSIALFSQPAHMPKNVNPPTSEELYESLSEWLDNDHRVTVFKPIPLADNVIHPATFSMGGSWSEAGEEDGEPHPHGHVHVARFERPISMKINVARKFQPQDRGANAIPAENYFVAWDGVALLVMWKATAPKSDAGFYGGFAAIEVLREAVQSLRLKLIVEPCGPNCDYPFAHRDLFISQSDNATDLTVSDRDRRSVDVECPPETDDVALARKVLSRLAYTTRTFAHMRTYATTVTDNDSAARWELTRLLELQYDVAKASALGLWKSISARWSNRGKPRKMALLTAGLWLRLVTIEDNRRRWRNMRSAFDTGGRYGEDKIFGIEYEENSTLIESIDIADLRSAIEGMTQRADARTITLATVVGAIAGGAVGAIIAFFAGLASSSAA